MRQVFSRILFAILDKGMELSCGEDEDDPVRTQLIRDTGWMPLMRSRTTRCA